jgi:predicted phosphodiesterase
MIYVTGDTHGFNDIEKLSDLEYEDLTHDDYVIVCGDFGDEGDEDFLDTVSEYPFTTLFIDGNHENHVQLNSYDVDAWHGGNVHILRDNVIHLMRGQVFEIDGILFFTMGGARTVDMETIEDADIDDMGDGDHTHTRLWRSPFELPSADEWDEGFDNLERHNNKVDYIITHQAPPSVFHGYFGFNPHPAEAYHFENMSVIDKSVKFTHWYCGHLHEDVSTDSQHTVLFNEIREVCPDSEDE